VDRANIDDVLVNFDFATPDMVTGVRHQTTVPQQALFLMNSPQVIELAKRLVAMPAFLNCTNDAERLQYLYERIYQRLPEAEETDLGVEFVNSTQDLGEPVPAMADPDPQPRLRPNGKPFKNQGKAGGKNAVLKKRAPLTAWQEYAQALLQGNETSFVN